jgi:hypothetical protein
MLPTQDPASGPTRTRRPDYSPRRWPCPGVTTRGPPLTVSIFQFAGKNLQGTTAIPAAVHPPGSETPDVRLRLDQECTQGRPNARTTSELLNGGIRTAPPCRRACRMVVAPPILLGNRSASFTCKVIASKPLLVASPDRIRRRWVLSAMLWSAKGNLCIF